MLQWLKESIDWLVIQLRNVVSTVNSFVSNPYPYIAAFLDWAYNRARWLIEAVRAEIANWTYGLYLEFVAWRNWFNNILNNTVLPVIATVSWWANNISAIVYSIATPVINNAIATVNGWIVWFRSAINNAVAIAVNTYNLVVNTVMWYINNLIVTVNQLTAIISGFDFGLVWNKIGELTLLLKKLPLMISKTVLDSLLDWLEDKLAEALE